MAVGIATIHPPTSMVIFTSFINYLTDIRSFTAFVARTPEQYRRLVSISQHHTAHTFSIHRNKALVSRNPLVGMCLYASLINDIQSVASCIFQVAWHRGIMACSHTIKSKLFQDGHILFNKFVSHCVAVVRVLHVRTLGIHL